MNVVWIGGMIADRDFQYVIDNEQGYVQFAAQKVCSMLQRGLDESDDSPCEIIYGFRVSNYPVFKKIRAFNLPDFVRPGGGVGHYASYLTVPFLCYLSTGINVFRLLAAWRRKNSSGKNVQLLYSASTPYLAAAYMMWRLWKIPFAVIVPDLPEFCGESSSIMKRFLRNVNNQIVYFLLRRAKGLILFSSHMVEKIKPGADCIVDVVEGCVDVQSPFVDSNCRPLHLASPGRKRVIMYAGALFEKYGVGTLLRSFMKLKTDNVELWLCGNGDCVEEIKAAVRSDQRIIYFGTLPNAEVVKMQHQADLLINPRNAKEAFTRYSFPSKNLEYLYSGTAVALMMMDGIPQEYAEYIMNIKDDSEEAFIGVFQKMLSMSDEELNEFGKRGQKFVIDHKNYKIQGEKIRNMLNKIVEKY